MVSALMKASPLACVAARPQSRYSAKRCSRTRAAAARAGCRPCRAWRRQRDAGARMNQRGSRSKSRSVKANSRASAVPTAGWPLPTPLAVKTLRAFSHEHHESARDGDDAPSSTRSHHRLRGRRMRRHKRFATWARMASRPFVRRPRGSAAAASPAPLTFRAGGWRRPPRARLTGTGAARSTLLARVRRSARQLAPGGTAHRPGQRLRLLLHGFGRGRRLLHQRRILLRHLVHLRDRLVHLLDPGRLLLATPP